MKDIAKFAGVSKGMVLPAVAKIPVYRKFLSELWLKEEADRQGLIGA